MNILVAMPKGIIRDSFFPPEVIARLENLGVVDWNDSTEHFTVDDLKKRIRNRDICITGWGCRKFDREVLEAADKLKLVAHTGGTVAPIVSEELYDRGIKVISGNRFYAESVAEGVIAYMLSALRDIPLYANEVQEGRWITPGDFTTEGLLDQTVGIIGYGMIAKFLAKMLQSFRVKIKVYSRHISDQELTEYSMERASLEEIFSTCKIISIHASKRPETYHMIGKELLERIPAGSLLVNTARGSIIDEGAMEEELRKGRFKAILDVYEEEPLPAGSKLRGLPNVILMPHMAGPTADRRKLVSIGLMEDISGCFGGGKLKYEIDRAYASVMTM